MNRKMALMLAGSLGCAASLLCLVAVLRLAMEYSAQRKTNDLIKDLQSLQIGESAGDVRKVAQKYGGSIPDHASGLCNQADTCFVINTGLPLGLDRFLLSKTFLQRWGFRPWIADADLELTQDKLSRVFLQVGAGGRDGQGFEGRTSLVERGVDTTVTEGAPYYARYIRNNLGTHLLEVWLTPDANVEQHERAFDFNLSCVVTYRGCDDVSQVMPAAWSFLEGRATGIPSSN